MRPQTLLAAGLSLLTPLTSAIITGIAVPDSIAPSSQFKVIIQTANYIQSVQDVAIAFGFAPTNISEPETLGLTLLSSKYLGPDDSNILTNITHLVDVPASAERGDIVFTGALYSLFGARYGPTISYFTVNTTVGDNTSANYKSSTEGQ
ncbi:MAG: hypothetical protein M1820_005941 [Bogoriella megaspora]|nr:MAG: hypothetical protein M1820_005941 [Bogoriella megaspora]